MTSNSVVPPLTSPAGSPTMPPLDPWPILGLQDFSALEEVELLVLTAVLDPLSFEKLL